MKGETHIQTEAGVIIAVPSYPEECTYVRLLDESHEELAYWDHAEWQESPAEVMGAIFGAVCAGPSQTKELTAVKTTVAGGAKRKEQDASAGRSTHDGESLVSTHGGERGVWGEHAVHPRSDWQYDVANGDTNLGYWDWVAARVESSGD